MKNKPLLIVLGEPNSIFSEILFKAYKKKIIQKFNRPIVIIGSENLLKLQMKFLKYSIKIQKINVLDLKNSNLNKKYINIVNVINLKKFLIGFPMFQINILIIVLRLL